MWVHCSRSRRCWCILEIIESRLMTAQVRPRDTCHATLHVTGHAPLVTTHSWWCEVRGGDAVTSLSQFCHASPRRCHVSRDGAARGGPDVRTHVSRDIQNQMSRNAGGMTSAPAPANLITPLEADWGGLSQCIPSLPWPAINLTKLDYGRGKMVGGTPADSSTRGRLQLHQLSRIFGKQDKLLNYRWRQPTRDNLFSFHVDQQCGDISQQALGRNVTPFTRSL